MGSEPGGRRRGPRAPAALLVAAVVLVLCACTPDDDPPLSLEVPRSTGRASVVVAGRSAPDAEVLVGGGALPVLERADRQGRFRADVPLRPRATSALVVTARTPDGATQRRADVRQATGAVDGTLTGQVLDGSTGEPLAGAAVSYGTVRASTGADGRYVLDPVPDGTVAARVELPGRLPVVTAGVVRGTGDAGTALLQPEPPVVTVGDEGARLTGPGWRLEVPAGAADEPVGIRAAPATYVPTLSALGHPLLAFDRGPAATAPAVTITLDPVVTGLPADAVEVVSYALGTGRVTVLPSSRVGDELLVRLAGGGAGGTLVSLRGLPTSADPTFCTPYATTAGAALALRYLRTVLLPVLWTGLARESHQQYSAYLEPGTPTATRYAVTSDRGLREFATDPETTAGLELVWLDAQAGIATTLPSLDPPESPTVVALGSLPSERFPGTAVGAGPSPQGLPIEWGGSIWSLPVNLMGGVGGAHLGGTTAMSIPDERHVDGDVRLVPEATDRGVLTRVTMEAERDWELVALDSIDFCPGGAGNRFQRALFTEAMSRLEVTPHPSGHHTTPLLNAATAPLDTSGYDGDVTEAYPGNDEDGDEVPEAQPWSEGGFELDNCPEVANRDQADRDRDGTGDACDTEAPSFVVRDFRSRLEQSYARGVETGRELAIVSTTDVAKVQPVTSVQSRFDRGETCGVGAPCRLELGFYLDREVEWEVANPARDPEPCTYATSWRNDDHDFSVPLVLQLESPPAQQRVPMRLPSLEAGSATEGICGVHDLGFPDVTMEATYPTADLLSGRAVTLVWHADGTTTGMNGGTFRYSFDASATIQRVNGDRSPYEE